MKEVSFVIFIALLIGSTVAFSLWKINNDRMENGDKYCKAKYGIESVYIYPECYLNIKK